MSNYSETDFCTADQGLDYIFARMMAIFGTPFNRHFDGIDPEFVRQEWKNQLGRFLTYRPSMDFAIAKLEGEFIPSAIKFRNLCNQGPHPNQRGFADREAIYPSRQASGTRC